MQKDKGPNTGRWRHDGRDAVDSEPSDRSRAGPGVEIAHDGAWRHHEDAIEILGGAFLLHRYEEREQRGTSSQEVQ